MLNYFSAWFSLFNDPSLRDMSAQLIKRSLCASSCLLRTGQPGNRFPSAFSRPTASEISALFSLWPGLNMQHVLQMFGGGRLNTLWRFPLSLSPLSAHRIHGDVPVLQLHRGPAAAVVGQRSQVLCPAQLPRRHRPAAGKRLEEKLAALSGVGGWRPGFS